MGQHWYRADGRAAHNEGKDGKGTEIRDVRRLLKEGVVLFPSATTIIGDRMPMHYLSRYKAKEVFLWSELAKDNGWREPIRREVDETDDAFFDRLWSAADTHKVLAGEKGTQVHSDIEKERETKITNAFRGWLAELGYKIVLQEQAFVNLKRGYAGTIDLILEDQHGQHILADIKGQEWDPEHKDNWKRRPSLRDSYGPQMGAYHYLPHGFKIKGWATFIFNRNETAKRETEADRWHVHHWQPSAMREEAEHFGILLRYHKLKKKYKANKEYRKMLAKKVAA